MERDRKLAIDVLESTLSLVIRTELERGTMDQNNEIHRNFKAAFRDIEDTLVRYGYKTLIPQVETIFFDQEEELCKKLELVCDKKSTQKLELMRGAVSKYSKILQEETKDATTIDANAKGATNRFKKNVTSSYMDNDEESKKCDKMAINEIEDCIKNRIKWIFKKILINKIGDRQAEEAFYEIASTLTNRLIWRTEGTYTDSNRKVNETINKYAEGLLDDSMDNYLEAIDNKQEEHNDQDKQDFQSITASLEHLTNSPEEILGSMQARGCEEAKKDKDKEHGDKDKEDPLSTEGIF